MIIMVMVLVELMVVERQLQGPLFPAPTPMKIVNAGPGRALVLSTLHTKFNISIATREASVVPPSLF